MKTVDMRGEPCPLPVVHAKNALGEAGAEGVELIVDNIIAVQNLHKMADRYGYVFSSSQENEAGNASASYRVNITKTEHTVVPHEEPGKSSPPSLPRTGRGVTILITNEVLGGSEAGLGRLLMKGFLFSLTQLKPLPETIIFINSGVCLAAEGKNTVDDLKTLEAEGCVVYVCGTCVDYFNLASSLAAGRIVDMMVITECLALAERIITL